MKIYSMNQFWNPRKIVIKNINDALGIIEDKDPDSFYDLYSEWPVPEGNWIIIKLMVVIILLLIVKIKPMFWSWLMI